VTGRLLNLLAGSRFLGGALLLCALLLFWSAAGAVDIIVNRGVSLNALSLASARAIFGMRQVKWPDGTQIRVYVLPDDHATHGAVCKERLNLFPYQLRQSWDRLVYSGMAQAPSEASSEEELMNKVAATPGAIGYVRKVRPNDPVKIINIE
jgi:ABC-type phosphate transport system substrate-binding protein